MVALRAVNAGRLAMLLAQAAEMPQAVRDLPAAGVVAMGAQSEAGKDGKAVATVVMATDGAAATERRRLRV
jgi:hypothetical protein